MSSPVDRMTRNTRASDRDLIRSHHSRRRLFIETIEEPMSQSIYACNSCHLLAAELPNDRVRMLRTRLAGSHRTRKAVSKRAILRAGPVGRVSSPALASRRGGRLRLTRSNLERIRRAYEGMRTRLRRLSTPKFGAGTFKS